MNRWRLWLRSRLVRVEPGDVVVLKLDSPLVDSAAYQQITDQMKRLFPNNEVAILAEGTIYAVHSQP